MRYFICLGLTILLSSCATTTSNYYTKTVQSWHGSSINDLIKRWGTADIQVQMPNGNTIYSYKTESYTYAPAPVSPVGVNLNRGGRPVIITPSTPMSPSRSLAFKCTALFVANPQGRIIDTQMQGNGCYRGIDFANKMSNPSQN